MPTQPVGPNSSEALPVRGWGRIPGDRHVGFTWNFPGKNTGVSFYFLLQWVFLTQGLKPASSALAGGFFTTEPPGKLLGMLTEALMASE